MSTNLTLALCNACEWRASTPDSPAGLCLWCEGEARFGRTLTVTEEQLFAALDALDVGRDSYFVWPDGLVACGDCACVFVPGFDGDTVLRYRPADDGAHLNADCACHTLPDRFCAYDEGDAQ